MISSENFEKDKVITETISGINKKFGTGSIMIFGEDADKSIPSISTGSISLDTALGIGGLPAGRIVELYGAESSGKTTLTLHVIHEAQRQGKICAFIDVEHALDPRYAENLGVDVNRLLISQPTSGEEALEITESLIKTGNVGVIVIDSVAALVPKAELEGEMGDSHMGLQARLMSQAMRKLTAAISKSNCLLIFINQVRSKIGVMFGSPQTTTGGNALKFYCSIRMEVKRIGNIKEGEETIGSKVHVSIVKNKVSPPFKTVELDILYGKGISKYGEICDLAVEHGIFQKAGAWISYGEKKIGQGRSNAISFLEQNPDIAEIIKKEIISIIEQKKNNSSLGKKL